MSTPAWNCGQWRVGEFGPQGTVRLLNYKQLNQINGTYRRPFWRGQQTRANRAERVHQPPPTAHCSPTHDHHQGEQQQQHERSQYDRHQPRAVAAAPLV